jgi:signal transduction histidine kinase
MRSLLRARAQQIASSGRRNADIWAAAAQVVAEAARDRDRVIGVLSHELRQALGAALVAERLLLQRPETDAAIRAAAVLDRQLLHLSRLVETLLDYSRLSVGSAALVTERLDARDLMREAVELIEPAARERHLEIELALAAAPQPITVDRTRIRQALSNLLQNALRYTPDGGRIRCASRTDERDVQLAVADTGCGIAAEAQARIFDPFVRSSTQGAGLGVGLALSRRIAELHEGRLLVHSDGPGTGATFTLVLPLHHDAT